MTAKKSRTIAFRAEPSQQQKLLQIAGSLGKPNNMSVALRYLVDRAPETPGPYKPTVVWEKRESA